MAIQTFNSVDGFSIGISKTMVIDDVANISANSLSVSDNANITGNITANGNVQGQYFIGDGSKLTGIAPTVQVYETANIASGVNGYYTNQWLGDYTEGTLANVTATVSTTASFITGFITEIGYPNLTVLPIGSILVNIETQKGSGSRAYSVYAEIYARTTGGTETLLVTTDTSGPSTVNTIIQQNLIAYIISPITLATTDRIVVKMYGQTLTGTAAVSIRFDGGTETAFQLPALPASISNFVPYIGATANLNLGSYSLQTTGNISANYYIGNGSQLTGLPAGYANSDVANYLASGNDTANIITTANISGAYILGNGSALTSITGANVTGIVASATVAASANSVSGANVTGTVASATLAGTVTTAAQPNITSTGILTSLAVTGNITSGNVSGTTGAFTSVTGNGAALTALNASNISSGTLAQERLANSSLTINGTAISLGASGTVTANAQTLTGTSLNATVVGSSLTSVGTLGSLAVTGNIISGNVSGTKVTATTLDAGNIEITGDTITSAHDTITIDPSTAGAAGLVVIAGNLQVTGTTTTIDSTVVTINDLAINVANNAATAPAANGAGLKAGPVGTEYATWLYNQSTSAWTTALGITATGNISGGNVSGTTGAFTSVTGSGAALTTLNASNISSGTLAQARLANAATTLGSTALTLGGTTTTVDGLTSVTSTTFVGALTGSATTAGTVTSAAQPNITSVGTLTSLTVTGTTSSGNLTTGGNLTANGTINFASSANVTLGAIGNVKITGGTNRQALTTDGTGNLSFTTLIPGGGYVFEQASAATTWTIVHNLGYQYVNIQIIDNTGNSWTGRYDYPTINFANSTTTVVTFSSAQAGWAVLTIGSPEGAGTAGTVTSNAQPNITSVGTLTSLAVSGNITSGNVSGTTGAFTNVSGNGSALTELTGANVTGQVANALVAGTVYTAAQPNITSVGTLTTLAVTGNITSGNVSGTTGAFTNVSGNGSALTALNASNISTGTLAQARLSNSSLTVNGTAISLGGSETVTANAQTLTGTSLNATVVGSSLTSVGTLTSLAVTGNITSGNVSGTKVTATTVDAGNIEITGDTITSAHDTITIDPSTAGAAGLVVIAGNLQVTGTTTTIDSTVVTINDLAINVANNAATAAAANGAGLKAGPVGTEYATWLYNQATSAWTTALGITATGNISGGNVSGTTGAFTNVSGNGSSLTALTGANVTGTVASATVAASANSVDGANVTGTVSAATTAGTVTTAAQPNITSTGTLTSLDVTGNITGGNLNGPVFTTGTTSNIAILDSNFLLQDDVDATKQALFNLSGLTTNNKVVYTLPPGASNTSVLVDQTSTQTINGVKTFSGSTQNFGSNTGNSTINLGYGATVSANTKTINIGTGGVSGSQSNINIGPVLTGTTAAAAFSARTQVTIANSGGSALTVVGNIGCGNINGFGASFVNIAGNGSALTDINASNVTTGTLAQARLANAAVTLGSTTLTLGDTVTTVAGLSSVTSTAFVGTLTGTATSATTAGTVTTAAQPNITSTGTLTSLSVTGNTISGNLNTAGAVVASTLTSNVAIGTAPLTITSTTRVNNLNVAQSGVADSIAVAAGTGNNFLVFANAATGNVTELTSTGLTANLSNNSITATTFVGALSGAATSATTSGTVTTAAQPNITSTGTLTSLAVTGNITSGNVSGTTVTGTNVKGGNITVSGDSITSTGSTITIDPGSAGPDGLVVIAGNLQVTGTTTTIDSTIVTIDDLVFNVADNSATAAAANGSGLGVGPVGGEYATWLYNQSTGAWTTALGITATGNISGGNVLGTTGTFTNVSGNGSALTALNASNISTGTLAQARLANAAVTLGSTALTLGSTVTTVAGLTSVTSTTFVGALTGAATSATTAGTVTTAAQPNITSTGTLTSLEVTGALTTTQITTGANTTAGNITGNWTLTTGSKLEATYADLAEKYVADAYYEPGTVVQWGGAKEITIAESSTSRVAGVVSTNPAYIMNGECSGEHVVTLALQGRVPCHVMGPVRKGDMMVSAGNGLACASVTPTIGTVIGKAIENFDGDIGVIEIVVDRF